MFDADLREKYERARIMFQKHHYAQADALLEEIGHTYPNHPDILYARARCLGQLGRIREARVLANKLQSMHNDKRAVGLHAWLKKID